MPHLTKTSGSIDFRVLFIRDYRWLVPVLLLLHLPLTATAQVDYLSKSGVSEIANLPLQPVGPGDLLNVVVYGLPNMSRPIRVSSDGNISLPMIEQPIRAEGFLPGQLEATISGAFQKSAILVDPIITVTVIEYQSLAVTVSGAVKKPLVFQAIGTVRLLDAVAKAEGLSPEAGNDIIISRAKPDPTKPLSELRIPVKELLAGSSDSLNVVLHGGDLVRVPEAGKVLVVGNVKKPGAYRVENPSDTSVLRMVALSEGLLPYSTKFAYVYRQESAGAPKTEIPVPLREIMQRKQSDFPLRADDILYIPDDTHRRLTASVLDRIASFGAGTASGVLIWRK